VKPSAPPLPQLRLFRPSRRPLTELPLPAAAAACAACSSSTPSRSAGPASARASRRGEREGEGGRERDVEGGRGRKGERVCEEYTHRTTPTSTIYLSLASARIHVAKAPPAAPARASSLQSVGAPRRSSSIRLCCTRSTAYAYDSTAPGLQHALPPLFRIRSIVLQQHTAPRYRRARRAGGPAPAPAAPPPPPPPGASRRRRPAVPRRP
jgi:hypothetical protein